MKSIDTSKTYTTKHKSKIVIEPIRVHKTENGDNGYVIYLEQDEVKSMMISDFNELFKVKAPPKPKKHTHPDNPFNGCKLYQNVIKFMELSGYDIFDEGYDDSDKSGMGGAFVTTFSNGTDSLVDILYAVHDTDHHRLIGGDPIIGEFFNSNFDSITEYSSLLDECLSNYPDAQKKHNKRVEEVMAKNKENARLERERRDSVISKYPIFSGYHAMPLSINSVSSVEAYQMYQDWKKSKVASD